MNRQEEPKSGHEWNTKSDADATPFEFEQTALCRNRRKWLISARTTDQRMTFLHLFRSCSPGVRVGAMDAESTGVLTLEKQNFEKIKQVFVRGS